MNYPTGSEKSIRIQGARQGLLIATLVALADSMKHRGTVADMSAVDLAARELVDALDQPEKCFTCGQDTPC